MAFFCDSCKLSCRQRRKEHVPLKEPVDLREIQHFRQRHCLRVEPCTAADKDPFRLCRRQSFCQRGNGLQMEPENCRLAETTMVSRQGSGWPISS